VISKRHDQLLLAHKLWSTKCFLTISIGTVSCHGRLPQSAIRFPLPFSLSRALTQIITDALNDRKTELKSLLRKIVTDQHVTNDINNTVADTTSRLYTCTTDEIEDIIATLKQMIFVQSQMPNVDCTADEAVEVARDRMLNALKRLVRAGKGLRRNLRNG
jgi:hypothetical protein